LKLFHVEHFLLGGVTLLLLALRFEARPTLNGCWLYLQPALRMFHVEQLFHVEQSEKWFELWKSVRTRPRLGSPDPSKVTKHRPPIRHGEGQQKEEQTKPSDATQTLKF
jgi:hypothetical protein